MNGPGTHSRWDTADAFWMCWPGRERSALSQAEAAELLGVCERTFVAGVIDIARKGSIGCWDLRLQRHRRAPVREIERMLGLYREALFAGLFTVKHFHEQLGKRHNYTLGYTVTKLHLHRAGLVTPAKTRSAHRKKRPRRPMVGMMLHQDASTHAWLPGVLGKQDLVVTMEDATSELYSAFLVDEEGTASSLRGVREVVAKHGLFCSLYTDRGSHYFETPEAGGRVSKTVLTQFGRALNQLRYRAHRGLLAASPRAKWSERERSRHAAGPAAEGVCAGWDQHGGGRQLLASRGLHCGPQRAVRDRGGSRRVRAGHRRDRSMAGDPVHSERTDGGQRQHGEVANVELA